MKRILILVSLLFAACGNPASTTSAADAEAHPLSLVPSLINYEKYNPAGQDVTTTYSGFFNGVDQSDLPADLQRLKGYKVILIEGILGNYIDLIGKLFLNKYSQFEYYYDYIDWFKHVSVEYEELSMNHQASVSTNQAVVAQAIANSTKPVLIISHSKGGIETIVALSGHPELFRKVAGVIFLQTPFMGTPIADYMTAIPYLSTLAGNTLRLIGGSSQSLTDLTSYERVPWTTLMTPVTDFVQTQIPMLSFATWKDNLPGEDTAFELTRDMMLLDSKVKNDGMIPWNSMILPHSRYVAVEGNDHGSPVTNDPHIHLDRVRFIKALIRTLYAR